MAGLLLAGRSVTLLPACGDAGDPRERERFEEACRGVRRYRELMEGWGWSMPLWRAGVIGSMWDGEDAGEDVREARERVRCEERFEALRSFLRETPEDALDELARIAVDLIKGGSDPGVSVPMAAGLDAFAARHGLFVIRPEASSVAQKGETRLGARRFAFLVPVLLEGEGERVVEARTRLAPELDELREMVERAWDGRADEGALRDASRVYAQAFETERSAITRVDDPADERVVVGLVSVTGLELPSDAALRASAHAARVASGRRGGSGVAVAPALGGRVRTLVVKVVSR